MDKFWIAVLVMASLSAVFGKATNQTQYDAVASCQPYCDAYGYYQRAKWCHVDGAMDVFCCGSEHDRYCCADKDKDIGDLYPPVDSCPMSSWWYYQWRVIIGLIGTLVVMLMMAACCYFCCGGNMHNRAMRRRRRAAAEAAGQSRGQTSDITNNFDPSSLYAFTPPDYDSLPKDPPKYGDIYDSNGIINPGYVGPVETVVVPVTPNVDVAPATEATEMSDSVGSGNVAANLNNANNVTQNTNTGNTAGTDDSEVNIDNTDTVTTGQMNSTITTGSNNSNDSIPTVAFKVNSEMPLNPTGDVLDLAIQPSVDSALPAELPTVPDNEATSVATNNQKEILVSRSEVMAVNVGCDNANVTYNVPSSATTSSDEISVKSASISQSSAPVEDNASN